MCDKYDIDDKTRFLVLYIDAQFKVHEIAKIINRTEKIVSCWASRTKKGENITIRKKGSGRKKSITADMEDKIIHMIKEDPEGLSTTKLAARTGISRYSIAKILAKKGFRYKAFDNSLVYDEQERILRIDYCKRMLSDDGILIYRAFFSDEMGIDLNKTHKTKIWQTSTEKVRRKNVAEHIKLNCWGAISAQGATTLDIYENGMNGDFYQQVIKRHVAEMKKLFCDGEFYFVQDNHPAHRVNEEWMVKDQKLGLIRLPKRSPDLNIIENLWAALKERVASEAPANEKELRESLLANWKALTNSDRLQPFFEGLHRRYIECVAIGGQKVPY